MGRIYRYTGKHIISYRQLTISRYIDISIYRGSTNVHMYVCMYGTPNATKISDAAFLLMNVLVNVLLIVLLNVSLNVLMNVLVNVSLNVFEEAFLLMNVFLNVLLNVFLNVSQNALLNAFLKRICATPIKGSDYCVSWRTCM